MVNEVICIKGMDRCGKDTVANVLMDILDKKGVKYTSKSFADTLKNIVSDILMMDVPTLNMMKNNDSEIDIYGITMSTRDFIIHIGNILRSELGSGFILNPMKSHMKKTEGVLIIPDIRFKIEYDFLKGLDIKLTVLEIISNRESCGVNGKTYELDSIISDYTVYNNCHGTVNIYKQLNEIF